MICKNCGCYNSDDVKFCINCGAEAQEETNDEIPMEDNGGTTNLSGNGNGVEHMRDLSTAFETYNHGAGVTAVKKAPPKKVIVAAVAAFVVVVAVVIGAILLSNYSKVKEISTALDTKSAAQVNAVYSAASPSLKEKYDGIIGKKIDEIKTNLNEQDFDTSAEEKSIQAVYDYLNSEYGTLAYNENGANISPSVSDANSSKWSSLQSIISSKCNFCSGIYNYKTTLDYSSAIEAFSNVSTDDLSHESAVTYIADCTSSYIQSVLKSVEQSIADGDVGGGLDLLNEAKAYLDSCGVDSQDIQSKIDETVASYAKSYYDKAEACFKDKDVNGAIGNIEVAMKLQPDNGDYKAKYDAYQQYLPFALYLEENVLYEDETGDIYGNASFESSETGNNNEKMANVISWYNNRDVDDGSSWNLYYNLAGKYNTVSGTIFLSEFYKSTDGFAYFKAFGDGKLLYTSPKITAGVLPQEISFDVSGVQKLTLSFYGEDSSGFISDLTAQKDFPE